jgi:hypothetical protein
MPDPAPATCPYCGESVEIVIDEAGGSPQRYVEDCPVCCRPWSVEVLWSAAAGWSASVRTQDD